MFHGKKDEVVPVSFSRKVLSVFRNATKKLGIIKKGITTINHGDKTKYQYPISHQLIKDGRKNKVFSKKIFKKIQISMFHGKKDEVVPVSFSKKVLSIFKKANKKLVF